MDTLIIVNTLGIYLIVSGLFVLAKRKSFPLVLKDFIDHPATLWLAGFFLIVIGGIIAFDHSQGLIVTIFGWLILIKGILYIFSPKFLLKITNKYAKAFSPLWGIAYVLLGLWLLTF